MGRVHGARGHVPQFLQVAGHGGTVSRITTNKKLTKLCRPKRLIVQVEPRKWRGPTKRKTFKSVAAPYIALRHSHKKTLPGWRGSVLRWPRLEDLCLLCIASCDV